MTKSAQPSSGENFVAAQAMYDRKIDTHVRRLLPHLEGHDRSYGFDDVKQEMLTVLWRVVVAYDPDRGANFSTVFWMAVQNRSTSLVREVTAAKRKSEAGVVSFDQMTANASEWNDLDRDDVRQAIDNFLNDASAEEEAMARLTAVERWEGLSAVQQERVRNGRRVA